MFSHIFIGVTDFDRALAFYQPVMAALGIAPRFVDAAHPWAGWQSHPNPRPLFLIGRPFEGEHAPGNGQMTAFAASTRAQVLSAVRAPPSSPFHPSESTVQRNGT